MSNLDKRRPQDLRTQLLSNGDHGRIVRIDGDGNCLFKAIVEHYKHVDAPIPPYLATHKALRAEVARALTEPKYQDAITTMLSDERGVMAGVITTEDRDAYIHRMATLSEWGGFLELQIIAEMLQKSVIVHQAGVAIRIPQGTDYDTWPVAVELIHESVNVGLTQGHDSSNHRNHYNLVMPELSAQRIVAQNQGSQLSALKAQLQKCPYPCSKEINHFKALFFSLDKYCEGIVSGTPTKRLNDKYQYHFDMIWGHLLYEFMKPLWYSGQHGYDRALHDKYTSGPVDVPSVKNLLKEAMQAGEIKSFFRAYPYTSDLLLMEDYLNTQNRSVEQTNIFLSVVNAYIKAIQYYDRLLPLFILREHLILMLSRDDFDEKFYINYAANDGGRSLRERQRKKSLDLLYLAQLITREIPHGLRMLSEFKSFKWQALERLAMGFQKHYRTIGEARLLSLTEQLACHVDNLMLCILGQFPESALSSIHMDDIELIGAAQNIKPAWRIIEDYLRIVSQVTEDNEVSRLAILRTMTAVGEAIRSIALLLPMGPRKNLDVIAQIRDHIVHATTLESFNYMNALVRDSSIHTLFACLADLKDLIPFFAHLKVWLSTDRDAASFPVLPDMSNLTGLEHSFTQIRHKDDRDELIPIAQRQALLASLPSQDTLLNPLLPQVEDFVRQGKIIHRNDFTAACPMLSAGAARKIHERIIEFKKITRLEQAIHAHNVDFDKIDLKVTGDNKKELQTIITGRNVEALCVFLDDYRKKVDITDQYLDDLLKSITIIDISHYKVMLNQFVNEGIDKITKNEFDKAVSAIFRHDREGKRLWDMSYEMLTKKKVNAMKRYQIIQLDHATQQIERLKHTLDLIFNGEYIRINDNLLISIACEMLYGFCTDGFKNIKRHLECMYDYQDRTLYFFQPNHPLQKTDAFLNTAIAVRNDIFHFERVYELGGDVGASRMMWFSVIQNLTHGIFFPNAISITPLGAISQASMSSPIYQELRKLRETLADDLGRDENLLNMWEAKMGKLITTGGTPGSSALFPLAKPIEPSVASSSMQALPADEDLTGQTSVQHDALHNETNNSGTHDQQPLRPMPII